jgi:hypothetical protein
MDLGDSMARRWAIAIIVLLITGGSSRAQIVENPEKPPARDAFRVKKIEEVLRIGETEGFFLSYPRNPKIGPDGSIYVLDQDQLLQFSAEGKFLRNLHTKGQGPGEFENISDYHFDPDSGSVVLYGSPPKILFLSQEGEPGGEFAVHAIGNSSFVCAFKGLFWFSTFERKAPSDIKGMEAVIKQANQLVYIGEGFDKIQPAVDIPTQLYVLKFSGGGAVMAQIARILIASAGRFLFLSHTAEYEIKVIDLSEKRLLSAFRRSYPRVRTPPGWRQKTGAILGGEPVFLPAQKYFNDIEKIFVSGDNVWVVTSTVDSKKGTLIDVFDFSGRYQDAFYLPLPPNISGEGMRGRQFVLSGDILVAVLVDEDEIPVIVKYRILP